MAKANNVSDQGLSLHWLVWVRKIKVYTTMICVPTQSILLIIFQISLLFSRSIGIVYIWTESHKRIDISS